MIAAVGEGVAGLQAGDRVAYTMVRGTYAEFAVVPAVNLVKIPACAVARNRRRGAAAGRDRALPDPVHVSAGRLRTPAWSTRPPAVPAAWSCRWRRGRREGYRNGGYRGESAGGAGARRRPCRHLHRAGLRGGGARLTGGKGSTWSTTRSAARRSTRASRRCARAGCWCCSASRAGRRTGRSADAQCRVAVSHAPQPGPLHHGARRAALAGGRGVRPGRARRIEGARLGYLSAGRGRPGASRSRGAQEPRQAAAGRSALRPPNLEPRTPNPEP